MHKVFLKTIRGMQLVLFLFISANTFASENSTALNKEHIVIRYDFSKMNGKNVVDLSTNAFEATLYNTAKVVTIGTETTGVYNVLDLGTNHGLMNLNEGLGNIFCQLEEFTISVFFQVDNTYTFKEAGSPIMSLSNSLFASSAKDGFIELTLANLGYEISPTDRSNQAHASIGFNKPALQGYWHHIVYTQSNRMGTVYFDGNILSTKQVETTPKALYDTYGEGTTSNYIGHSTIASESHLDKTMVYDFCIIDYALSKDEINETILDSGEQIRKLNNATKAYRGTSKTHETSVLNASNKGVPSKIVIYKNSDELVEGQISDLNEITFDQTNTTVTWNNAEASIVENSTISKITFADYKTSSLRVLDASNEFLLYPNPAKSEIHVQNSKNTISIYSITGRLVQQIIPESMDQTIDISQLKNGIYLIKSGNNTQRLIKK